MPKATRKVIDSSENAIVLNPEGGALEGVRACIIIMASVERVLALCALC